MKDAIAQALKTEPAAEQASAEDVAAGKMISTIGYIITPIAIIPFVQKNNAFSLYHAKQALSLFVTCIALSIAVFAVTFVLALIKLGLVGTLASLALSLGLLTLVVMGAMNAWAGRMQPLPLIGPVAKALFGAK